MTSTPTLKLHYFDFGGRAALIRLILKYSKIEFEDHRIQFSEWSGVKQSSPLGQLPYLEVDGVKAPQTCAILRYVSKLGGLMPEDPVEYLLVDSIVQAYADLLDEGKKYFRASGDKKKELAYLTEEFLPVYLTYLESFVGKHISNGYCVGGKLTVADFVVFSTVEMSALPNATCCVANLDKLTLTNLKKVHDMVSSKVGDIAWNN